MAMAIPGIKILDDTDPSHFFPSIQRRKRQPAGWRLKFFKFDSPYNPAPAFSVSFPS